MSEEEDKRKLMEEARQLAWSTASMRIPDIERIIEKGPEPEDADLIVRLLSLILGEIQYRHIDTSEGI